MRPTQSAQAEIRQDASQYRVSLHIAPAGPSRIGFQIVEEDSQANGFNPQNDALPVLGHLAQMLRGDLE